MGLKRLLAGGIIAPFIGIGVFFNSQSIYAAVWHRETPAALRGHWRTGIYHQYGYLVYDTLTISKHMLNGMIHAIGSSADASAPTIWNPKCEYLGHHLYKFKGMGIGGFKAWCWIKWQDHDAILVRVSQNKRTYHYYR